jgi:peptide-methionine (S)-S-oxide reductase
MRPATPEVVQVTFDPAKVSYETLVDAFWHMHDPTQVNRQGPDFGSQYRSAIFTHSPEQEAIARKAKAALDASKKFPRPIATEITPAGTFYRAEEYHQRYLEKARRGQLPHLTNRKLLSSIRRTDLRPPFFFRLQGQSLKPGRCV